MVDRATDELDEKSTSGQFEVVPFLFFLLKRWYLLLLFTALGFAGAKIYLRYATPLYEASARIVLNEKRENDPLQSIIGKQSAGWKERSKIENDLEKISSREITRRALEKLDRDVSYYDLGRITGYVEIDNSGVSTKIDVLHVNPVLRNVLLMLELEDGRAKLKVVDDDPGVGKIREVLQMGGKNLEEHLHLPVRYENQVFTIDTVFAFKLRKGAKQDGRVYFKVNSEELVIKELMSSLKVKRIGDQTSSIISVSSTSSVARFASDYVNAVAESYIEFDREEQIRTIENAILFIDKEVERLHDSLDNLDNQLTQIRKDNKLMNLEDESVYLLGRYRDLIDTRNEIDFKLSYIAAVKKRVKDVNELEEFKPPVIVGINDPVFMAKMDDITQGYDELAMSIEGLNKQHPRYGAIKAEFNEKIELIRRTLGELEGQLETQLSALDVRLGEVTYSLEKHPELETILANLDRSYKLNESLYTLLLEKKIESGIQLASVVSDHNILSYATKADKIFPAGARIIGLGGAVGLLAPVALMLLMFLLDTRIKSIAHITSFTDVPFLGILPKVEEFGPAFIFNYPKSLLSESLRSLKNSVNYLFESDRVPVLLITSSQSGEGKTFTAENLGAIYAYGGSKTVIIGGDLRRPKLFSEFHIKSGKGLSEYLAGQAEISEIIIDTGFNNLYVIGAGANPPNPAELLERKVFAELLDKLKEQFDLIIIDSPPFQVVTDTGIIAKHCDAVLFVLRHNYTKREAVDRINGFADEKLKNLGVVLNVFEAKAAYGYKYSHYKGNDYGYRSYYGRVPSDGLYTESKSKKRRVFWKKNKS